MLRELTEVITTAGNEMINIKNERFIKLVSDLANSFFTLSISNLVFFFLGNMSVDSQNFR